ncbi:hypothetical protein [Mahella australiensis]|uniref:Uncharacterized protein n=1 Tax=Mahella australiensis (strain DSM 15567 / CIP 107919 / 50-1 BON) TaxID=697281 RepID=F3ZX66_MAHA5|nr:hypothetical protein [Mahella australiensis]AEE95515.1 hypothetical protein Mahau_0298 [Mahella australiensis 50-1 BON]
MEFDFRKGSGGRKLGRTFCFALLGIAALYNPLDPLNLSAITMGAAVGLLFGSVFRSFLITFIGLFNKSLKKDMGKQAVAYAVDRGMLFLFPFVIMAAVATFYLNWSMTAVFVSAGIMAVGTAAALEVAKLKGASELKNTIASGIVSYVFSFAWTLTIPIVAKAPAYLGGALKLLHSFLESGGGLP